MKIYLAGGMGGDWQDKVMQAVPEPFYFDPRSHGFIDPTKYTAWDLDAIDASDLVFAFYGRDNPSGVGMSLEIGYAAAKCIPIILVDEVNSKYWNMAKEVSSYITDDLESGIEVLRAYVSPTQCLRWHMRVDSNAS